MPDAPARSWDLLRFVLLRGLGFVYLVAWVVWARQGLFLVGHDGLTPADLFLSRVAERLGADAFTTLPTVFWLDDSDGALLAAGVIGVALSLAVALGLTNAAAMAVLWGLHVSVVNVGQIWYGYGWETLLAEAGFLGIFLAPLASWSPRGLAPASQVPIWLFRWLTFRLLLGAGLIKVRGDPCWQALTCLVWHYETQPNPHPLSILFHNLPLPVHQAGALYNHVVELIAPWFLFGPARARRVAAVLAAAFQVVLIASGNLAFLNWLTLVIGLAAFDDALLDRVFPRLRPWLAVAPPLPRGPVLALRQGLMAALVALVAWRSVPVVDNLFFADDQVMNGSFDRLHLVNTYGAFGSVGELRDEAVIQGTNDDPADPAATWLDYELPCKPGDPDRRSCWITPYHLHLDWQMWFVPLRGVQENAWLAHLVAKLLAGDPDALAQLAVDPFPEGPPRAIRVARYRYRFAPLGDTAWWHRERKGNFLRPLTADDPDLAAVLAQEGWAR